MVRARPLGPSAGRRTESLQSMVRATDRIAAPHGAFAYSLRGRAPAWPHDAASAA
jgi:hypothetical protein